MAEEQKAAQADYKKEKRKDDKDDLTDARALVTNDTKGADGKILTLQQALKRIKAERKAAGLELEPPVVEAPAVEGAGAGAAARAAADAEPAATTFGGVAAAGIEEIAPQQQFLSEDQQVERFPATFAGQRQQDQVEGEADLPPVIRDVTRAQGEAMRNATAILNGRQAQELSYGERREFEYWDEQVEEQRQRILYYGSLSPGSKARQDNLLKRSLDAKRK